MDMADRLQKLLSSAGIASRRKAEDLIAQGRVMVNGKRATVGDRADAGVDIVTVDGRPIAAQRKRYLVLNKPSGHVTTTSDPQGRPKVSDLVDVPERIVPVGRLDYDTEGLLLLSNDGEFTQRITHPSYEIDKVYVARVATPIGLKALGLPGGPVRKPYMIPPDEIVEGIRQKCKALAGEIPDWNNLPALKN